MLGSFEFPYHPGKMPIGRGYDGDQVIMSTDQSLARQGTWSSTPTGNFYALVGNQNIMTYWSHNVALDQNGNFLPRDEADFCSIYCITEDNIMRWYGAPNGARHTLPVFTLQASLNMITGAFTPSQTGGIVGTTTNNSANAGSVGELLTATIATPGTSLTTATPANVILTPFLSLTAGDWDVWGTCCFLPAATTSITQIAFGISATSATLPAAGSGLYQQTMAATVPGAIPQCEHTMMTRVSIASTTPYYLVAQAAFTVSTLSAFGTLYARRVR